MKRFADRARYPMTASNRVTLHARPQAIDIDLAKTAVICVDMQNAFIREGGMFALAGWPTEEARATIEPCRRVIETARAAAVKVVFVKMSYKPGLTNAGGPDSPNYHKEIGMVLLREHPEFTEQSIVEGTWGEQIIDELCPLPGEPVIRKERYSGFVGTDLDLVLKTLGVKYCLFIGGATNVCVAGTLMDAFSHDYWPILIADSVYSHCPPMTVEATLWNVENIFGWVTEVEAALAAFRASAPPKP
jgi:ureidoacrylate peracid hydrolase